MTGDLLQGLLQAIQPSSLLATGAGCLLGLVAGMIPGMTISAAMIIVLPLTFVLDPNVSIGLFLGLYAGGMLGGSFSAILLNIPGTPSAAATALDGYPLVARGQAGRALGMAVSASFCGGLFSALCLFLIAPRLADLALQFRSADLFSLVFLGLTIICSFASRSWIKGLLSAVIGLAIVTVGQDPVMGTARFTFGDTNLLSGVHFLTALIGLFAIPQLIENLRGSGPSGIRLTRPGEVDATAPAAGTLELRKLLPAVADLRRIRLPVGIGSAVGTFLGILPGAGGPIAAFISYDYAKKTTRRRDRFGRGAVEGVAAPEAANNAVTGGALIPMMTLGIPGDPVTAILIGALLAHGLAPGPLLFVEQADFAYGLMFSFFWANVFNLLIALAGLRLLVKVVAAPRALLMPAVAILCVVGAWSLRNSLFDVYVMFGFGLLGIAMKWLDMPVVPLLLALVLGWQLEENLRIALTGSQG
ncbi:MAG: tripartite tricarboxylate transporter permease, partial [Rhodospirillaceae bacterium]|nr:tripartite tricarboxylate transporter permease [Rhodospirillaceae bacterium]